MSAYNYIDEVSRSLLDGKVVWCGPYRVDCLHKTEFTEIKVSRICTFDEWKPETPVFDDFHMGMKGLDLITVSGKDPLQVLQCFYTAKIFENMCFYELIEKGISGRL